MDERYDVVVVGAGLAGLAATAAAAGAGVSTLVLDGHPAGGRASTDERGPYRFNRGAHALYQGGEATAVLGRLGVSVAGSPPPTAARGRLGDHIGILPGNTATLLRTDLVGARGKLALARFLAGIKRWRPEELAGLTIGQWLDRFHLPDDARRLVLFLVRTTTYLHDEDHVSADVAASQIQIALGNGVEYLHGGWAVMVEALASSARRNGAEIRTDEPVTAITGPIARDGAVGAGPANAGGLGAGPLTILAGGRQIEAGAVVLAAGTPEADAALLGARPAAWAGLGPQVEASCLDLGLRRGLAEPILFGVDVPMYLVDHAAVARDLAPEGGGLVHVLRYLALGEDTAADALRTSLEEHARLAGVDPATVEEQRFLRRMTVVGATPTPATGGLAGRPGIDSTGLPGVYVAGDWVGPRGWLADCSLSSGEAAGVAAARTAALANRRSSVPAAGTQERRNGADPTPRRAARQDVA
jgi:phytoene dehydrogenase-like protein